MGGLTNMALAVGASGAAGLVEYDAWEDLPSDPDDGAEALVGDVRYTALDGDWLPAWMPRSSLLTTYCWELADAAPGAAWTLGAPATKSAGQPLRINGSGTSPVALQCAPPATKGTMLLTGITNAASAASQAIYKRPWLYNAGGGTLEELLLPGPVRELQRRNPSSGALAGRPLAVEAEGVIAYGWNKSSSNGGIWIWTPTDTGAGGGAGTTLIRADSYSTGATLWRWFCSLAEVTDTSIKRCRMWSAT